jgi:hypothetical protein
MLMCWCMMMDVCSRRHSHWKRNEKKSLGLSVDCDGRECAKPINIIAGPRMRV